jgi:hypothetical protein
MSLVIRMSRRSEEGENNQTIVEVRTSKCIFRSPGHSPQENWNIKAVDDVSSRSQHETWDW